MQAVAFVVAVGWIGFWLFWLAASTRAKSGRTRWGRFAGVRVAVIVLVLALVRAGLFKGVRPVDRPVLWAVGLTLWALGLALAVWARVHIGRNWGMPMSQKDDPELVTSGPYAKVRHPIYSGIILAMIGSAVAIGVYWIIAAVVVSGYFIYSALGEERYMTTVFPESYPEYKRRTKMLVPLIF